MLFETVKRHFLNGHPAEFRNPLALEMVIIYPAAALTEISKHVSARKRSGVCVPVRFAGSFAEIQEESWIRSQMTRNLYS